jgi:transposase
LITPLVKMRAALLTQVRGYDQRLRQQAAADAVCRRLMSTPGVGPLTALAFRSGIDQLGRFRRAADVPAALGLTPRIDQSGGRERIGAITKAGDRLVRTLLFEAANALLTRTKQWSALKRWGLKVAQRRGMNRARVAVARRLAIVLFAIWRDGTAFRARTAATAA